MMKFKLPKLTPGQQYDILHDWIKKYAIYEFHKEGKYWSVEFKIGRLRYRSISVVKQITVADVVKSLYWDKRSKRKIFIEKQKLEFENLDDD